MARSAAVIMVVFASVLLGDPIQGSGWAVARSAVAAVDETLTSSASSATFRARGTAPSARELVIVRPGFTLTIDARIWKERRAAPPSMIELDCVEPGCDPDTRLTAVGVDRPLLLPGAGAFGPGAITGAAIVLNVQALTPGTRLLQTGRTQPLQLADGTNGYRGDFLIEWRDLSRTVLMTVVLPIDGRTLHVRLTAPRFTPALQGMLDAVIRGIRIGQS